MSNKKAKSKNMFKKSISAVLASIMTLGSGAAITTFNKTLAATKNTSLKYFNDGSITEQTRIMMDGNNFLNTNYWMNATIAADANNANKYTAKLEFTIPGYENNLNDLKFYVRDRSSATSGDFVEYSFAGGLKYLYLTNLNPASYEVHVYNKSLAAKNFVCKAEFSCIVSTNVPTGTGTFTSNTGLVNAVGEPITATGGPPVQLKLTYDDSSNTDSKQIILKLPSSVVPYNASTVKVAFFAQDEYRGEAGLNIDHILYDYTNTDGNNMYFVVDPQWGTTDVSYDVHFYKDSVKTENFICKAVGVTLNP